MSWRDKIAAVLAGKVGGPTPTGIHAYHSSPHDFDRFDLGKIGTGEGAQVYGHGIYVAENPAVSGQGGQYWQQFLHRFPQSERDLAEQLKGHGFDRGATAETLQRQIDELQGRIAPGGVFDKPHLSDAQKRTHNFIAELSAERDRLLAGAVGPRTYEVNFRAKPEELLDWDKPLAQMSPEVQERLQKAWLAHPEGHSKQTGGQIYESSRLVRGDYRDPAAASKKLADAGIPGIRYLDEGSRRGAGGMTSAGMRLDVPPKTYNYVAFDPSKLDIMAKYGVVGGVPLGAATMGGTIDQSSYGDRQ